MSYNLAEEVYSLCKDLPKHEQFGLISQLQRSSVSIPSNIAEGEQRGGNQEFKRFLGIARGSAAELSTQLLLANSIYKIDTSVLITKAESVQKILYVLQSKL